MEKKELINYIDQGREIEFNYQNKKYSITYGIIDDKNVISFCEYYKETTEVESVDELLMVMRDGISVLQMVESLTEDDVWVY